MGATTSKNEHWQEDSEAYECYNCHVVFSISVRRHHCRNCGYVFCWNCSDFSCTIPTRGVQTPVRVCGGCFRMLSAKGINRGGGIGKGCPTTTGFANGSDMTGNGNKGGYPTAYEGHEITFAADASRSATAAVMDNSWDTDKAHFVGAGKSADLDENTAGIAELYYNSYTRPSESTIQVSDGKGVDQVEKELLIQRWMEVRQRVVFTDIVLQQVERVEESTEVECFQEIENIMLQQEQPDLLRVMFPFPESMEGNAELLMEPITRTIPLLEEKSKVIDDTLQEIATQLTLLPAPLIRPSESAFLHQV